MRQPKYLSFSALNCFEANPEEYAIRYLTDTRPPREPQSQAAAAGSAFDAYEKADLMYMLTMEDCFDKLFEDSVEPHNRDWAAPVGQYLQECYRISGMHDELCELLVEADDTPRFEFLLEGEIEGVPIVGKPDCELVIDSQRIVLDWKVMGFCARNSGVSPAKGYRLCQDGFNAERPSKSHGMAHKLYMPVNLGSLEINSFCLEDSNAKWADQLAIYGWTLGDGCVGDDTVYMIDQLCCRPRPVGHPLVRVANFRAQIRPSYQQYVAGRLMDCWAAVTSGHIFKDLSREENDERLEILEGVAQRRAANPDGVITQLSRPKYRG